MFTIDFLKNQGLPAKSKLVELGVFAGITAISLLVSISLYIQYFHNTTVLESRQKTLTQCEAMVHKSSGEGSVKFRIEKKLAIYKNCRSEIANSIGRYVQWTPVLHEFIASMPPSMLLNELSVIRTIKKIKVTSILDAKKKADYELITRILKSDVYDFVTAGEGVAVADYLNALRSSESLKGVLEEAYIVESNDAEYEDSNARIHKVKNHVINCLLKSQEVANAK